MISGQKCRARRRSDYLNRLEAFQSNAAPIRPERFVAELSDAMPADGVLMTDPGTPTPYLAAYYRLQIINIHFRLSRVGRF